MLTWNQAFLKWPGGPLLEGLCSQKLDNLNNHTNPSVEEALQAYTNDFLHAVYTPASEAEFEVTLHPAHLQFMVVVSVKFH